MGRAREERPVRPGRISRRRFLGLGAAGFAGVAGLVAGCGQERSGQGQRGSAPEAKPYSGGYDERFRPQYHFSPENGWMNDPNGLVFYRGEYHLFFQHNPSGDVWGNISWGHAVSRDLVRWEELPVALEPDDLGLIWSGSAVVDDRDTSGFFDGGSGLVAIYTNASGKDYEKQVQSIAHSTDRGRTWTKFEGNPVIPNPDIKDFRDPKVFWHEGTRRWVLLLAADDRILFYSSKDLKDWQRLGEFGSDAGAHGGVWECPELFELPVDGDPNNKKWVLQVDVNPGAVEGGSGGQYFVGDFDGEAFTNDNPLQTILWVDYGKDFYATQDWSDVPARDGRRLWIAWMNNWQYAEEIPTDPWRSAMSVPREVTLTDVPDEGVRIVQKPVSELETLRTPLLKRRDVPAEKDALGDLSGQTVELVAEFEPGDAREFGLRVLKGGDEETVVGYDNGRGQLFVDRTRSGNVSFNEKFAGRHEAPLVPTDGRIKMHVFVDRSSVEVFGNGGLVSITDQVFPDEDSDGIEAYAAGGDARLVSFEAYGLRSVWR